jgi:Ca2+-binding EF-hand superfamily protein
MRTLLLLPTLALPLLLVGCGSSDLNATEPISNYDTLVAGLSAEDPEVRVASAEGVARFDLDGDGALSGEELETAREVMRGEFLVRYDLDEDGVLSNEEQDAARSAVRAEFEAQYDANGDGEISLEEREEIRKNHPGYGGRFGQHGTDRGSRRQAFLERYDHDGDGVLSEIERQDMEEGCGKSKRGKRRGGGRW